MNKVKKKLLAIIKKHNIDTTQFHRIDTLSLTEKRDIVDDLKQYEKRHNPPNSSDIKSYLFDISANLLRLGYKKELKGIEVSPEELLKKSMTKS